jgi:hypothetical protein
LFHWPKPILGVQAALDAGVEGGVRPVNDMRNAPVFDRVEVDIANVRREILVVANGMLPAHAAGHASL